MISRNFIFSLFVILFPLQSNLVKADEWDLSKVNFSNEPHHIQKWCPDRSAPSVRNQDNEVRYSNIPVAGYQPCGELKTMVVCDALGKKLISSGPPPYGFKECTGNPRIVVERIGPPLPQQETQDEPISLAKNSKAVPADPKEQIVDGLKGYQNYISGLDQLVDEKPTDKKKKPKNGPTSLAGLTGNISPSMLTEAMKMLSEFGQ